MKYTSTFGLTLIVTYLVTTACFAESEYKSCNTIWVEQPTRGVAKSIDKFVKKINTYGSKGYKPTFVYWNSKVALLALLTRCIK